MATKPAWQPLWNRPETNVDVTAHIVDNSSQVDWDFAGHDTQLSTHGLHTYVAAMIPALARKLIDEYVPIGGSVLDPFCGGGAVLVEAILSGRRAFGRDVNSLATLVSKAKTTHITFEEVSLYGDIVLATARNYNGPVRKFPKSAVIEYWFKDYMLMPLTGLSVAVGNIPHYRQELKTLFQVLLSATVRSVSLTYRNEVRLRRMRVHELDAFNPDVFGVFEKHLRLALERIPALPISCRADICREDVRRMSFGDSSIDAIVCSPPYGDERNGVNYTQFAKNMLYWLGFTQESLREAKQKTLGWGPRARVTPPSASLAEALSAIADNPIAVREAVAFYSDYYTAISEMIRVAKGRVIIVIGNRVLHKHVFDNALITTELMHSRGVTLEAAHHRQLPTKRLPRMREHGAAINKEAILVYAK